MPSPPKIVAGTLLILALLSSVTLLSACRSTSAQQQEAAEQYLQSQVSGDWPRFCQLLSAASVNNLQRLLAARNDTAVKPCPAALAGDRRQARELQRQAQGVNIERVEDLGSGSAALVFRRQNSPFVGRVPMVEENGRWRLVLTLSERQ